ncbi:MAG: hypothetical protein K6T29_09400, partial [Peptococcaceae bacterium]|nr:hypothetical protein [Peptococcaceae bacterium]
MHDALRGGFAETLAGMQLLERARVPFRVTTVVSAANVASLDLLVLLLSGFRHCQGIGLDLLTTKGQALENGVRPAAPEAWRQAIGALLRSLAFSNRRREYPLRWREWETVRRARITPSLRGFCHAARGESLAVHPQAAASPFFRRLPLARFGLEWITPPAALAHPFDGGAAVLLWRSLGQTASGLGADGGSYQALMERLGGIWPRIEQAVLGPLAWPRHPAALAQFGWLALQPAIRLVRAKFKTEQARALFGGIAAHGMLPLDRPLTAAFALVLAVAAHRWGWPLPRGGAQRIASALAACLRAFGGAIVTGARVYSLDDAPRCR